VKTRKKSNFLLKSTNLAKLEIVMPLILLSYFFDLVDRNCDQWGRRMFSHSLGHKRTLYEQKTIQLAT